MKLLVKISLFLSVMVSAPAFSQCGNQSVLSSVGEVLVVRESDAGSLQATLFALNGGDSSVKYQRVMTVLNAVCAEKRFVSLIGERLKNSRLLKRESFTLPLTDEKRNRHIFEFISDEENQLYTLNYKKELSAN